MADRDADQGEARAEAVSEGEGELEGDGGEGEGGRGGKGKGGEGEGGGGVEGEGGGGVDGGDGVREENKGRAEGDEGGGEDGRPGVECVPGAVDAGVLGNSQTPNKQGPRHFTVHDYAEVLNDRLLLDRLLRARWRSLSEQERGIYVNVSLALQDNFQELLEKRKEEERRRRQESYSLELSGSSRRSTYTSMQSGGAERHQYAWGSPREVPASTRKMRTSWRAACLYATLQLNATSPDTAVTKTDMIAWIHAAKPEILQGDAPFYLGIHISNLVRDGILASFQPALKPATAGSEESEIAPAGRVQSPQGGSFGRGRQAHMYYAVEGAAEKLDFEDVWPMQRSPSQQGRRGRVPRVHDDTSEDWMPGGERGSGGGHGGGEQREGKGYGAGEGGVTIRQSQAAMLRHIHVCRARRAEFVLGMWDEFAPFFEPPDRDLANGMLARRLHQLSQFALSLPAAFTTTGQEVSTGVGRGPLLPVRGQPACIKGTMREYQIEGLKWMVAQHDKAAGGILGDEMGLGKTLQVISFLGFLKTVRREQGPHLVVAPLSVMNGWILETAKWCPELRIITFHGSIHERERLRHDVLHKGNYDLCVTTYEMLVADLHGFVARSVWNYLIVDEAHRIKNENTQLGHAVRRLRCSHRLLITGTPLQNNMHELWSLLNILFPVCVI